MNEKIQFPTELRLCVLHSAPSPSGYSTRWHSHPFAELGLVLEGECVWQIHDRRDRRLRRGDLVLIPAHCPHREESTQPVRLGWVGFDQPAGIPARSFCRVISGGPDTPHFRYLLQHLYAEQPRPGSGEICSLTLRHLLLLFRRAADQRSVGHPASAGLNPRQVQIVQSLATYLERNAHQPGSLNQVAEYHRLSPAHLSDLFQQFYQVTPTRYRLNRRMELAQQLLGESSRSIKEIAAACGFSDTAHFCREYRRHTGRTPTQSRIPVN